VKSERLKVIRYQGSGIMVNRIAHGAKGKVQREKLMVISYQR